MLHESRTNGQYFGYTATSYPNHTIPDLKVFTVTYYDRYDFLSVPVISGKSQINRFRPPSGSATESTTTIGLETASLGRILGTNDFLLSETIYDHKRRVSNVIVEHHLNGVDEISNSYNFVGELLTNNRKHYKDNALALTINNQNTYDHVGRITHSSEQINQQDPTVTKYSYNALGQLEVKRMGDKSIVHSYNPRGWLSKASSSLFNYSLYYDFPSNRSNAQFNGTISGVVWTSGMDRTAHEYAYTYDRANRLLSGMSDENHGETLTYDKMGNITSLVRTGPPSIAGASGTFAYDYGNTGNQLQSFTNGSSYSRNFQYNDKGNMVADGQIKIAYNELNLPVQVKDYNNNLKVDYLYDVTGRKLRKQSPQETRHYVNGIEYMQNGTAATVDFLHMQEGIARNIGDTYHYEYFLKDHLDNTRVVYDDGSAVLQQTDYYPFGMEINRKISSPKIQYTYNGKEFQEDLDQYDYGARFYDPVVGRWSVVDPLAENYPGSSPYNYVDNNPILRIDPDGRDWIVSTYKDKAGKTQIKLTYYTAVMNSSGMKSSGKDININSFMASQKKEFEHVFGQGNVHANLLIREVKSADELNDFESSIDIQAGSNFSKNEDGSFVGGRAGYGGKFISLSADGIGKDGSLIDKKMVMHEIGHTGGLIHTFEPREKAIFLNGKSLETGKQQFYNVSNSLPYEANFMNYSLKAANQFPMVPAALNFFNENVGKATQGQIQTVIDNFYKGNLNYNNIPKIKP